MVTVRPAEAADAAACMSILAGSPDHFAPSTHTEVADGLARNGWVATDGSGTVLGFLLLARRFPYAAEILHAAVAADRRSTGVGSRLLTEVLDALRADGVRMVLVKTLDESTGYAPFVRTRAFWTRHDFIQVDMIDPLPGWQPGNPAALLIRTLARPAG
jgi:GNAT superfamily N-acetyltransferase